MGYVCVDGVFTPAHAFINKTKHGEKDKKIFDYTVCDFDGMRRERVRVYDGFRGRKQQRFHGGKCWRLGDGE